MSDRAHGEWFHVVANAPCTRELKDRPSGKQLFVSRTGSFAEYGPCQLGVVILLIANRSLVQSNATEVVGDVTVVMAAKYFRADNTSYVPMSEKREARRVPPGL